MCVGKEGVPEEVCIELLGAQRDASEALTAGFSNDVWKTAWNGRSLVVKRFTDLVLLRNEPHAVGVVDLLASDCGIGPHIHHATQHGLVMDFLPGRTLEEADLHCGHWSRLDAIAAELCKLHRQAIPLAAEGEPMLWRTIDKMLLAVDDESLPSGLPRLEALREELAMARAALEQLEPKVVCGHGDFKPSNIIEHEGTLRLIDFEVGGPNYRGFDWMKLFRRPEGISMEDLEHFLRSYAGHEEGPTDLTQMLRETLAFEPLTWLEAYVFFLAMPKHKPAELLRWHRLAEHRWRMYQQTRHRLL